jgi:hypothetical protein
MSMNDDDLEFEDLMLDDELPAPATLANDDDEATAAAIQEYEEMMRAVSAFRAAHNVPDSWCVLIRRNPNGGPSLMEAMADPLDGLQSICENSKAAAAIRLEGLSRDMEKEQK